MKFYQFLTDPNLAGLDGESFSTWHVVAKLLDGDGNSLKGRQRRVAQLITGRTRFHNQAVRRFAAALGRRSGKTLFEAQRALYFAAQDYRNRLTPGERAVIAVIATDRAQAGVLFNYARAVVLNSSILSQSLVRETNDTLEFTHNTTLEVYSGNFRSVRGRTFAAVLLDEAAFLRSDESALPDVELVRAVTPGLATLNGSLEIFSSPYMRRGVLWDMHRKHYGIDDSAALVVQGETRLFNPTIDQSVIDEAVADDPEAAQAEWLGNFRNDLSAALDPAWIDNAVGTGVYERPRVAVMAEGRAPLYVAFTDPAGGSGKDSWSTRVSHLERNLVYDDALLEIRPPFNTKEAAHLVADFLKSYCISSVTGDRYAGEWPADALRENGIGYVISERTKSEIYRECIPLFSSGRVQLLDHSRTLTQLRMLERRVHPGGRDSIDHPGGSHDDDANSLCGALLLAAKSVSDPRDQQTIMGYGNAWISYDRNVAPRSFYDPQAWHWTDDL